MARDRQRAKQRRAERKSGEPADRSARDVERDIGLGGDSEPFGAGAGTPAPLDHSSAEVDEALLAEAGATPPPVGDDRAPDAVEGDAPRRGGEAAPHRSRGRALTFLGHCVDELRRVQWPDRRQVAQATTVVLGFVVIAGGYLGLLDALWKPLVEAII